MPLKISDSRSFKLQPMKKNNWVFQFSKIPGSDDQNEPLAFVAKSCSTPHVQFNTVQLSRMNEEYKVAGKPTWSPISCTFYDFIRTTGQENSAGDILYDWFETIYNPLSGQMGYKTQYATSATLAQLDPAGNIVRAWNLFGIFPTDVDWGGTLDYSQSEACEITATFSYDLAIKVKDAHTNESA